MNGTIPVPNGIDSDHSSVSDQDDTIPSMESLDDIMSLDNIELAINHVSQLLSYGRSRNGLMVHQELEELDVAIGVGSEQVFEREGQMKNLCQELVFLLSAEEQDNNFADSIVSNASKGKFRICRRSIKTHTN